MKLLNIANNIVKGNLSDLIAKNDDLLRNENAILKAIKKKKEQLPQFDFLFVVKMPDLTFPEGYTQPLNQSIDYTDKYFDIDRDINHRIFSINAPNPIYDTTKTQTKNTYWYSASNKDIGQITITFDEFEDALTLKYINAWLSLIENPDGTYNAPAAYKRSIKLIRYSGTKHELSVITYRGCFPTGISETTYSHEGSSILQYNVSFACDGVSYDIPDNIKAAIDQIQQRIKANLPEPSSAAGLNVDSAINILGRVQNILF